MYVVYLVPSTFGKFRRILWEGCVCGLIFGEVNIYMVSCGRGSVCSLSCRDVLCVLSVLLMDVYEQCVCVWHM